MREIQGRNCIVWILHFGNLLLFESMQIKIRELFQEDSIYIYIHERIAYKKIIRGFVFLQQT